MNENVILNVLKDYGINRLPGYFNEQTHNLSDCFVVSFDYEDVRKNVIPKHYCLLFVPSTKQNREYMACFVVEDKIGSHTMLDIRARRVDNTLNMFYIFCNFIMCKQNSYDWATDTMKNISITKIDID